MSKRLQPLAAYNMPAYFFADTLGDNNGSDETADTGEISKCASRRESPLMRSHAMSDDD
jgi:hypothetical protein